MSESDKKLWRKEKKLHIMFVHEELDKYRGLIMQQYIEGNELDKPSQYGGLPIYYVKKHQVSVGGRRKTKKNKRKSKKQKKL
uniref:Uncharacterized protein n=1 Tax=viral metagenome TaxID=1070528 RepID=A0A6C0BKV3_9ZZZZ